MMKNSSNMTIRDIAQVAGVSKATVSMVMNGSTKVSTKTCERVWAIIQDLNYQPSEEARRLAQRRWPNSISSTFQITPREEVLPTA